MPTIMRRVLLAAMACVLPTLVLSAGLAPITPEALALRQSRGSAPLVIDVRSASEYAAGHVPGAVLLPHDKIQQRLPELDLALDREIILYCRSGRRAALAEDRLRALGVTNLRQLEGHWKRWEAGRLPVDALPEGAAR